MLDSLRQAMAVHTASYPPDILTSPTFSAMMRSTPEPEPEPEPEPLPEPEPEPELGPQWFESDDI